MEWVQGMCKRQPWRFKQGFDWATSGNNYPEDLPIWKQMSPLMERWASTMQEGDEATAEACIVEMAPLLKATCWFANYSGKVQGSLQSACQDSPNGVCVAVCIKGGPVTRVECKAMPGIVQNVRIRGERGAMRETGVHIKVYEYEALKNELHKLV